MEPELLLILFNMRTHTCRSGHRLVASSVVWACVLQDHDLKEYKHQLKAEKRARKAAEAWLRSELKSRVRPGSARCMVLCFVAVVVPSPIFNTILAPAITVLKIILTQLGKIPCDVITISKKNATIVSLSVQQRSR